MERRLVIAIVVKRAGWRKKKVALEKVAGGPGLVASLFIWQ